MRTVLFSFDDFVIFLSQSLRFVFNTNKPFHSTLYFVFLIIKQIETYIILRLSRSLSLSSSLSHTHSLCSTNVRSCADDCLQLVFSHSFSSFKDQHQPKLRQQVTGTITIKHLGFQHLHHPNNYSIIIDNVIYHDLLRSIQLNLIHQIIIH
jgi:hypothetical protein